MTPTVRPLAPAVVGRKAQVATYARSIRCPRVILLDDSGGRLLLTKPNGVGVSTAAPWLLQLERETCRRDVDFRVLRSTQR